AQPERRIDFRHNTFQPSSATNWLEDCVRLLRYVGTLPKSHSRETLRGASHPRSFSHRGENEQGTGRNPRGRIAPHSERGRRARAKEVALAAAQTRRESEDGTALPVARSAPLQPEDRPCLPP